MNATVTCEKCGKPLGMFDGNICNECENRAVLDMIRAEIEQYEVECMLILPITEQTCNRCTNDTFKNIYQIIDHYTK